jgi:hypothetical protein
MLKRLLPDSDYAVWLRLASGSMPGPDFLVCHRSARYLLIKVSPATPQDARTALQGQLFGGGAAFGSAAQGALHQFWSMLSASAQALAPEQVPGVILFPNISNNDLRQALPLDIPATGRDDLSPERLPAWIESHLGAPLTGGQAMALRSMGTELEFVIMVIAVSCVKLLSAHNSTQHTSRKHKV